MSDIDRLLEAMRKHQATELLLEEGKRPRLVVGGSPVGVSYPELDRNTILKLVTDIMDEGTTARLAADQAAEFTYTTPSGMPVLGIASAQADGFRVQFRVDSERRAPDPEAANAPAAAPKKAASMMGPTATKRTDLRSLLGIMLSRGASDLHISALNRPNVRVDGDIVVLEDQPVLSPHDTEEMILDATPAKNRRDFQERDDSDFAIHIDGLGRFRVNVFRDRKGVGAVFRGVPAEPMSVEEIGIPTSIVEKISGLNKGLVLVTGPTGSGKSTTLTAIIDMINTTRPAHIITIEDPIEFIHENKRCLVNQREIGEHTQSFKAALRASLREDPDIILVGEMRDLETTEMAIETAETGHLVFGTLHTTTAVSTVSRVVDQFPADGQAQIRLMLADSLKIVMCQTLCKREGGGRVASLEVLVNTGAVANLIREGKTFQVPSIMQSSRGEGMILMNDALCELAKKKAITPLEAYAKSTDKAGIRAMLEKNQLPIPK